MLQAFDFDGVKVIYDTEGLPSEYVHDKGVRVIRPSIAAGERRKMYAEIRETAQRLLYKPPGI